MLNSSLEGCVLGSRILNYMHDRISLGIIRGCQPTPFDVPLIDYMTLMLRCKGEVTGYDDVLRLQGIVTGQAFMLQPAPHPNPRRRKGT